MLYPGYLSTFYGGSLYFVCCVYNLNSARLIISTLQSRGLFINIFTQSLWKKTEDRTFLCCGNTTASYVILFAVYLQTLGILLKLFSMLCEDNGVASEIYSSCMLTIGLTGMLEF